MLSGSCLYTCRPVYYSDVRYSAMSYPSDMMILALFYLDNKLCCFCQARRKNNKIEQQKKQAKKIVKKKFCIFLVIIFFSPVTCTYRINRSENLQRQRTRSLQCCILITSFSSVLPKLSLSLYT